MIQLNIKVAIAKTIAAAFTASALTFGNAAVAANKVPKISGNPGTKVEVGTYYKFFPAAKDPEGKTLRFSIKNKPSWATFKTYNGKLHGTPTISDVGKYSNIVITVSDGDKSVALSPFAITVYQGSASGSSGSGGSSGSSGSDGSGGSSGSDGSTDGNEAPTISGQPDTTATVGKTYKFVPSARDPEGKSLEFSIKNKPSWAEFRKSSGKLVGFPKRWHIGKYENIVIEASDGRKQTSLPAFTITVAKTGSGSTGGAEPPAANSPPSINGDPPTTVVQQTQYDFRPTASDPDGDTMTFSAEGKPPWASFVSSTGRLHGTPQAADVGTYDNIRISVSDGENTATLGPFSVSVNAVGLGSVTLSWTAPSRNTDGTPLTDLSGYRIYWGRGSGTYPNSVTIDNPGLTTYVLENLSPGTYEFVATAVNAAGIESDYSSPTTRTIQ